MNTYGEPFVPRDYVPITTGATDFAGGAVYAGLLITATGTIVVRFQGGNADRTINIPSAPFILPGYVTGVRTTGTNISAANIFGLLQ